MVTKYLEYKLQDNCGILEYKKFSKFNTLYVNVESLGGIKDIQISGSDYIINFLHSSVTLKNGKKNFLYIKTSENMRPQKMSSSGIPMYYYITAPQKGLNLNGTSYNDKILLSSYPKSVSGKGLAINAKGGNDYIEGSSGSDRIMGGTGTNTIFYNNKKFGTDTVILTKNEKLNINFDNEIEWGNFSYTTVNNKDLKIVADNFENSKIIVSDYASKDLGAVLLVNGIDLSKTPGLDHITSENYFDTAGKKAKTAYNGTILADYVDTSGVGYNFNKQLTIKTGAGNDTIIASEMVDNLTAGSGHNTIIYNNKRSFNGDKIYLTKGEKLDIDVSNIIKSQNYTDIEYKMNGKNLDVIFTGTVSNKFTIMNFGSIDASNNSTKKSKDTSSVKLITDTSVVNLKKVLLAEQKVTKNYTGTWRADNINAAGYKVYTNKNTNKVSTDYSKTGLKLDGAAGNDKIKGSKYSDTITGGVGNDTINAGLGNNTIIFTQGSGNDIVQNGGGKDTLVLNGVAYKSVSSYTDDMNLYIKYGTKGDKITIENFTEDYKNGANSVKFLKIGGKNYSIDKFIPKSYLNELNSQVAAWQSAKSQGYDISDTICRTLDVSANAIVFDNQSMHSDINFDCKLI